MLAKIDELVHDDEHQENAGRDVQKRQGRHQEKYAGKGLGGMRSERSNEIELGGRMMQAMEMPEEGRVIETMHPVAHKVEHQEIDHHRERYFENVIGRQRDPPGEIVRKGVSQLGRAQRYSKGQSNLDEEGRARGLQQCKEHVDLR